MLGKRLRELRLEKNLTQEDLGKHFSLSKQTISGYENGNRQPDTATLNGLADFFGVTTDYLLGRAISRKKSVTQDPSRAELKEILKSSDIHFNGAPLDDEDKEDLLEFIKLIKKKRKGR